MLLTLGHSSTLDDPRLTAALTAQMGAKAYEGMLARIDKTIKNLKYVFYEKNIY
jgi:hypothetical protein